jgi:hypothetical protein
VERCESCDEEEAVTGEKDGMSGSFGTLLGGDHFIVYRVMCRLAA